MEKTPEYEFIGVQAASELSASSPNHSIQDPQDSPVEWKTDRKSGKSKSARASKTRKAQNSQLEVTRTRSTMPKVNRGNKLKNKALKRMAKADLIEELEGTRNEVKRLKQASREQHKESEQEIEELHEIQSTLKQDLEQCKLDLIQLRPSNQVSDAEIARGFSKLSQEISVWVDEVVMHSENVSQGQVQASDCASSSRLFGINIDPDTFEIIKESPYAAEFLLQRTIFDFLQQGFFDECQTVAGMDSDFNESISFVIECMEFQREQSFNNNWRSDALASIVTHPNYTMLHATTISEVSKSLQEVICEHFSELYFLDESWSKLQASIVGPAADIANIMRLSPVWYFQRPMSDTPIDMERAVLKANLDHITVKDISTRKALCKNHFSTSEDDDEISEWMIQVEPNLLRQGGEGGTEILVRKGLIALKPKMLLTKIRQNVTYQST